MTTADGGVPTRLYRCAECGTTYISDEMQSCPECGRAVDRIPSERDLGIGSGGRVDGRD